MAAPHPDWPAMPYPDWKDTCETLHLWTPVVGAAADGAAWDRAALECEPGRPGSPRSI